MIDQELIQQLLLFLKDRQDPRPTSGVVDSVAPSGAVGVRPGNGAGTIMQGLPIVGQAGPGDPVKLLYFPDGTTLALGTGASGVPSSSGTTYAVPAGGFDPTLYYTRGQVDSGLMLKSDIGHTHIAPSYLNALGGHIGGFTIGATDLTGLGMTLHASLTDSPYLALGDPVVPTIFGPPAAGVWLGFDLGTGVNAEGTATLPYLPKLSLYGSPTDYLQWDGSRLLVHAAHFILTGSGNITATGGTIGGVSLGNSSVYVGAGHFNNPDTGFYLDSTGQFSLKNKLSWDGTTLAVVGTITAGAGTIGGWTIGATTLGSAHITLNEGTDQITIGAGLVLDGAGQKMTVGAAAPNLVIDGASKYIRSSNFASGLAGFNIDGSTGSAEFENVRVRGALSSSVFTTGAISTVAGSWGMFKSSAQLLNDVVVPNAPTYGTTTVVVDVKDDPGLSHASNLARFAVNEVLRLKIPPSADTWLMLPPNLTGANTPVDLTTGWRFPTVIVYAGTANVTYAAGMAIADYGLQSTDASILMSVDGTVGAAPSLTFAQNGTIATGVGNALGQTVFGRLGNLRNSYGYGAVDTWGLGVGEYGVAGKPWLIADATNGALKIGAVSLTRISLDTTNGLQLFDSAGVRQLLLDMGGNAIFYGDLSASGGTFAGALSAATGTFAGSLMAGSGTISGAMTITSTGYLAVGTGVTGLLTGTGIYASYNGGTPQFRMGVITTGALTNGISWDGATFKLVGKAANMGFGSTPPTSASAGTGIWLDQTGLYGLSANVQQFSASAVTGKISAAAGGIVLDSAALTVYGKTITIYDAIAGNNCGVIGGTAAGLSAYPELYISSTRNPGASSLSTFADASHNAWILFEANTTTIQRATIAVNNTTVARFDSTGLHLPATDVYPLGNTVGLQSQVHNFNIAVPSANLFLTTAYQDLASMTVSFTPTDTESVLVMVSFQVNMGSGTNVCNAGDVLNLQLLLDGIVQNFGSSTELTMVATGGTGTVAVTGFAKVSASVAAHTLKCQAKNATGARGLAMLRSEMVYWRVAA